jgi:hypothetical protein
VVATTIDAGRAATYSLTAVAASADLTCDDLSTIAVSPITTAQQLGAGDCYVGPWLTDYLLVGLPPNAGVTVSMASDAFQPHIELIDAYTGSTVAVETAAGTASLTFANGSSPVPYFLNLSSDAEGATGAYTVSVNITYASFNGAVAAAVAVPVPRLSRAELGVRKRSGSAPAGMAGRLSPMVTRP